MKKKYDGNVGLRQYYADGFCGHVKLLKKIKVWDFKMRNISLLPYLRKKQITYFYSNICVAVHKDDWRIELVYISLTACLCFQEILNTDWCIHASI